MMKHSINEHLVMVPSQACHLRSRSKNFRQLLEIGEDLPRLRPAVNEVPEKDEMGECLLLLSIR